MKVKCLLPESHRHHPDGSSRLHHLFAPKGGYWWAGNPRTVSRAMGYEAIKLIMFYENLNLSEAREDYIEDIPGIEFLAGCTDPSENYWLPHAIPSDVMQAALTYEYEWSSRFTDNEFWKRLHYR